GFTAFALAGALVATAALGAEADGFTRYDEAGRPPSVSASDARNAYGTLSIWTRGCSTSPGRFTRTPNHRGSPVRSRSRGRPPFCVAPISIAKLPDASTCTFCVSCQSGSPSVGSLY